MNKYPISHVEVIKYFRLSVLAPLIKEEMNNFHYPVSVIGVRPDESVIRYEV